MLQARKTSNNEKKSDTRIRNCSEKVRCKMIVNSNFLCKDNQQRTRTIEDLKCQKQIRPLNAKQEK